MRKGAVFFGLRDVRLGEGPFLAAQKLDEKYLLELEPDRMLHNFRVNAGLEPKAPVYGGWESIEPWIEIRCHGHTLGHYLTACACMFETTGDARFAERVDYIVGELALCQKNRGDGLVTAFPDNAAPLLDSLGGRPFAGVPWYTMHKIMAGLRDAHAHRGSRKALDVWFKLAGWIDEQSKDVSDADFQKMLDREHGGMNEVFADLFVISGDERHKRLALRFSHRALLDPLAAGIDKLDGLHSNTQIPKVIGFSRIHDVTGTPEYGRAAEFFWRTVVEKRSFATGGHGDVEHFFPPDNFSEHLASGRTMETCCTHNLLRLTRCLYMRDPRVAHFDYYERALFNGILASQDPETGMNTYFQSTRPGYVRLYHKPFDAFWCCTGSGIENHARYGENIYAQDENTLYVNLFLSSKLEWKERGLRVTQTTRFPDADTTRLEFAAGRGAPQLAIRQPSWCPAMTVTVNGKRKFVARQPGTYYRLRGQLRDGDVVELRTPMSLRLEPLPNDATHAAFVYGPIVLAGRMGTKGLSPGSQLIINERESGNMLNDAVDIPKWNKSLAELLTATTRTDDQTLAFTARGFEGAISVELIPWFRLTHERYNIYWRAAVS
ncbi:MAG: glycoside hydrolase family 127 protein [Steroidobacteraceae bacterium]|nr:glycoside hydrolase family 127 protein [Steroidobacteraceae bacterium]